jgi:hypothetical protein
MHAYFRVLSATVANRPLAGKAREGSVLFRVMGLKPEVFRVELRRAGCAVSTDDAAADLTVWTSRRALDAMLEGQGPVEELRVDGDRGLLDALAEIAAPGLSPLATRLRGGA